MWGSALNAVIGQYFERCRVLKKPSGDAGDDYRRTADDACTLINHDTDHT